MKPSPTDNDPGQRVMPSASGGYRGMATITASRRDHTGRIIRDQRCRARRRTTAHVEQVMARIKDSWMLRQCCRRGDAINHGLQVVAGLWNLKTHSQLRVNS